MTANTTPPTTNNTTTTNPTITRWAKLLIPIGIIILVSAGVSKGLLPLTVDSLEWLQDNQPISGLCFCLFYAAWVSLCLSKTPLSIAAGYIFGWQIGLVVSSAGMMFACLWALLLVRGCRGGCCGYRVRARQWILSTYPSINVVNSLMKTNPYAASFALRLLYVPSWVKNYGLALLDVDVVPLIAASFVSTVFYCLAFCYIGSTIETLADAAAGQASGSTANTINVAVTIVSLLLTVGVLLGVGFKVKKYIALEEVECKKKAQVTKEEQREEEVAGGVDQQQQQHRDHNVRQIHAASSSRSSSSQEEVHLQTTTTTNLIVMVPLDHHRERAL